MTIDGQVSGDYVETIETCCAQSLLKGKPVEFFLRDVSSIDEPGRGLLYRLAGKGIGLTATGLYSSYLVSGIKSGAHERHEKLSRNLL